MNTTALLDRPTARSAPKTVVTDARMFSPDDALVARRLAGLKLVSMPSLRQDVTLAPPDGGPEVCGPAVYAAPV